MYGPVIFGKTHKGEDELRTGNSALNPRIRQLLVLIDGTRDMDGLQRMFARHELDAYLTVLEYSGLITRASAQSTPTADNANGAADSLHALRLQALRHLLAKIGPAGEAFALRVTKCQSHEELRTLVQAMQSVVEVHCGPQEAQRFAREALHE